MACDRFIFFNKSPRPSSDNISMLLNNFMGCAGSITRESDRFLISLPGINTNALLNISSVVKPSERTERYIEVIEGSDYWDIVTRQHDEFTNALAQELANIIAKYWNGFYVS